MKLCVNCNNYVANSCKRQQEQDPVTGEIKYVVLSPYIERSTASLESCGVEARFFDQKTFVGQTP